MGYPSKKNSERGMREVYRDLAHVIHQHFCYNRADRREQCGLMLSAPVQADVTGWVRLHG